MAAAHQVRRGTAGSGAARRLPFAAEIRPAPGRYSRRLCLSYSGRPCSGLRAAGRRQQGGDAAGPDLLHDAAIPDQRISNGGHAARRPVLGGGLWIAVQHRSAIGALPDRPADGSATPVFRDCLDCYANRWIFADPGPCFHRNPTAGRASSAVRATLRHIDTLQGPLGFHDRQQHRAYRALECK